jgi:hypothetical protein
MKHLACTQACWFNDIGRTFTNVLGMILSIHVLRGVYIHCEMERSVWWMTQLFFVGIFFLCFCVVCFGVFVCFVLL